MKKGLLLLLFTIVFSVIANQTVPAEKPTLLFFINPNGGPCQMQDRILKEMGTSLTDKVSISYQSTTEFDKSRKMFEKYGIRALPSLILVDSKGTVIQRFTPGIQNRETIQSKIGK